MGGHVRCRPRPCRLPGFPPGPNGNGTSARGLRPTAASGRSFGPRGPPSARHFLLRRLWRSPAPAAAAVLRAARCQHGRPRAGAGVHDPRSAGAGQVGPRVVASLATPGLPPQSAPRPPRRVWRERGRVPGARVAAAPRAGTCPCEFPLRVKGLCCGFSTRLGFWGPFLGSVPSSVSLKT